MLPGAPSSVGSATASSSTASGIVAIQSPRSLGSSASVRAPRTRGAVAANAFKEAQPEIQRGVSKGILHKNTASRKISRLSARIKSMAG